MKTSRLALAANPGGALQSSRSVLSDFSVGNPCPRRTSSIPGHLVWLSVIAASFLSQAFAKIAPALNLAWDANSEQDIASYELSYGLSAGNYPTVVNVGNTTTTTVTGLTEGKTYYFVVSAYNQTGEKSPASAEISHEMPVTPPDDPPTSGWTLHHVDSEETDGFAATNAFDGDPATFWHTGWTSGSTSHPHEIQINLGNTQTIKGFRYLPRQDNFTIGNIGQYEFYISTDGVNWGDPVASGTFANTSSSKEVLFPATSAKYIRLRSLTEINGGTHTNIAELEVIDQQDAIANLAPVATSKSVTTDEDTPLVITLSGSDENGDALTYSVLSQPTKGVLTGTAPNLTYSPSANSNGSDSFTFKVSDGSLDSATATVSIAVTPVNDAPTAAPKSITTTESTSVSVVLSGSDPEGTSLTYTIVSDPTHGTFTGTAPNLTYTPATGYNGTDQFTYRTSDGTAISATATGTITVTALPPSTGVTLIPQTGWTLKYVDSEEALETPGTLAFDGNPNTFWHTKWKVATLPPPPHEIQINLGTSRSINGFRYLPRQDIYTVGNIARYEFYVSTDGTNWGTPVATGTFSKGKTVREIIFNAKIGQFVRLRELTEANGGNECNVAELNLLQGNVANQPPSAVAKSLTTPEDTSLQIQLAGSDPESSALAFSVVGNPAHGQLSGTPPNLTYLPDADFNGSDSFTYVANDGASDSAAATISITVTPVDEVPGNVAPVFPSKSINASATEDKLFTRQLSATDANPGDTLTYVKISGPKWLNVSSSGKLSGTPLNSNVGANSFSIKVSDPSNASATATLSVTVANTNDVPLFKIDPVTFPSGSENVPYAHQTLEGTAIDPDSADNLSYAKISGPGWLSISKNGALTGTPPTGSSGANQFTIRVTDKAGTSSKAALIIQILPSNLPLPWNLDLVGKGNLAGGARYNAGNFVVSGAGALRETQDASNFGWQTITGDGEISARVRKFDDTGVTSKVGVMIRESLAPNARQVFIGVNGNGNYRWLCRTRTGGNTAKSFSKNNSRSQTWLRLTRVDDKITAYKSDGDGNWEMIGKITMPLPHNCYIGLSVSSGVIDRLNTSTFSNVKVTP